MIDVVKHEADIRKTMEWCKRKQHQAYLDGDAERSHHWEGWVTALKWILNEE
jgi:hypothetical protein